MHVSNNFHDVFFDVTRVESQMKHASFGDKTLPTSPSFNMAANGASSRSTGIRHCYNSITLTNDYFLLLHV